MNLSRCVKDSIIALNTYDDVDIESTIYPTKCSMTIPEIMNCVRILL